jgi:hypothetical protein
MIPISTDPLSLVYKVAEDAAETHALQIVLER